MNSRLRCLVSCGWLLAPALIWNALLASKLPGAFDPKEFWRDIPPLLAWIENVSRVIVFALPFGMPLRWSTPTQRQRLGIFAAGTLVYFASWTWLIAAPDSTWSLSATGFLAPAATPTLWLWSLATIGRELYWGRFYRWWMYLFPCGVFLAAHITHAAIVWARN